MSEHTRISVALDRAQQRQETRELITAMLGGFHDRIRDLLQESMVRSGSLVHVVSNLLDSARQEVEDMWYRGDIALSDQRRMLRNLEFAVRDLAREADQPAAGGRTCVLVAVDDVMGEIDARVLEEDGWDVMWLRLDGIVDSVGQLRLTASRIVVVVGDASVARPGLRSTVAALQAAGSRVLVVAAGHWAQAGRWQTLGADGCAEDVRTMLLLARKLHSAETTFSISEVAGTLRVTPHTIRAWERRYRLPGPARDRGGQRRYSPEDVQLLLRVSHAATVHGHSLKLAALEAQGLLVEDGGDFTVLQAGAPSVFTVPAGESWRRVADAVPELMMLVDDDGKIVDCNVATARLRDTVRENLRGTRLTDMVIEYDRAKAARLYRPAPRRREAWEVRMPTSGDEQAVVAFESRVVATDEGRLLGLIGKVLAPDREARSPNVAA